VIHILLISHAPIQERQRAMRSVINQEKTVINRTAKKLYDAENNLKEPY
jgi:hypothetical protein